SRVRLLKSRIIYSGAISLRKDMFSLNGRTVEKEIVEHQQSVGIVPVIDGDSVLLVTQYRRAAGKTLIEIPAGKIERGETPKHAAAREMAEEIGFSGRLRPLAQWYLAPGYDTELMHVFVATELKKMKRGTLDEDEDIAIKRFRLDEVVRKCKSGKIQDCKTVAAILAYHQRLRAVSRPR
ncbi:MAG: NUDIX hydrolase, partial [Nitrososphaera sp.]